MEIEKLNREHIFEILEIGQECGFSSWFKADYLREIEREDSLSLVTVNKNLEVLGFIIVRLIMNPNYNSKISTILNRKEPTKYNSSEILILAIKKNYWSKGLGQKILNKTFKNLKNKYIREVWLEVRKKNSRAKAFYQKNNFTKQFTRKNYYTDPFDDALILKCKLSKESNLIRKKINRKT